jgi:lincosamide nucleotidyltransferase A/C/D/E
MEASEVLELLGRLRSAGLWAALDGGWGVDALLGELTRPHGDVDLVVALDEVPAVMEALDPMGFALAEDFRPTRLLLRTPDGRQADLHPVTFDEDGMGWQAAAGPDGADCAYPSADMVIGQISGQMVPCISAALQVAHHTGYAPRAADRTDMARLAERFALALPDPY